MDNDVLLIPVAEGKYSVARILVTLPESVFVVVYAGLGSAEEAGSVTVESGLVPMLFAETTDQKIVSGEWKLVGNWAPVPEVSVPIHQSRVQPGGERVDQWVDGVAADWLATVELPTPRRGLHSPAMVETAVRALHGLEPWRPEFEAFIDSEYYRPGRQNGAPAAVGEFDYQTVFRRSDCGAGAAGPVDEFRLRVHRYLLVADVDGGAERTEAELDGILSVMIDHPEAHEEFEQTLVAMVQHPTIHGATELVSFTMHVLRWPAVQDEIERQLNNTSRNVSDRRLHGAMLNSYSDSWRDKDMYVRFS
ncbi:hypothetical protein [Kribbella endophytica]